MKNRANIALLVETSGNYGRQILHGVSRYIKTHKDWSVFLDERERLTPPSEWLLDWKGDGIICRSTKPALACELQRSGMAVVDLNDCYGDLGLPYVASDMPAIGYMATQHLLEHGFRHIAYSGFSDKRWSKMRLVGVQKALSETRGAHFCGAFESESAGDDFRTDDWQDERARIGEWIQTLPLPVGIVACNDVRAQHVLDACRMLGVAVPEEVAVVGVDNDETLCELCEPPLSSVVPDAERIGFEAAALLCRLMKGESAGEKIYLPPKSVAVRQSSDAWAVEDPAIFRALSFMRQHACEGISIDDVVAHVRISRSTLERNFRRSLGHSPQEEIRRIRLKRVKQLLVETDLSLSRIAHITGYVHPEYLMVQFKRLVGQTPSQWRQSQLD
jgi:LacI family transcriptional regulator